MSFSDDMAEAMDKSELRRLMNASAEWQSIKTGEAFNTPKSGCIYIRAKGGDGNLLYDMWRCVVVWAPEVLDFRKPLKGQIQKVTFEVVIHKDG